MSRIGKKPIDIPKGVDVRKVKIQLLMSKGRKASFHQDSFPECGFIVDEGKVVVERTGETRIYGRCMDLQGVLYHSQYGEFHQVTRECLKLHGTGYRAQVQGNKLLLALGYSHR